ncbi:hypothetical protein GOBAR_AA03017 [Gossypium barbadense]|uniref:Uncharacterized protein n=1 Tax=Gossypium barbadense TaxID=3634 RepID=A0A2P5YPM2_GOSBA|nr:hypothetical protein GOBAR_AA03017 [Gossypium barbadense]
MRMRGKYGEYEVVFLFLRLEKIAVGRMLIFPKVKVILFLGLKGSYSIFDNNIVGHWNGYLDMENFISFIISLNEWTVDHE